MNLLSNPPNAPNLQKFQQQFANYLRQQTDDPNNDIPKNVGHLYQNLVFNNVFGFVNQCFPVCKSLLTDEQWLTLCRDFFQHATLHSPYFTEINRHFVEFLHHLTDDQQQKHGLPAYFAELADYEWQELAVETAIDTAVKQTVFDDLMVNPSVKNLHYQWAVHCISADHRPENPEDTFLVVYRKPDQQVAFMQINDLTYVLLDFMQQHGFSSFQECLSAFADEIGFEQPEVLANFAKPLIDDFIEQQILIKIDCK